MIIVVGVPFLDPFQRVVFVLSAAHGVRRTMSIMLD